MSQSPLDPNEPSVPADLRGPDDGLDDTVHENGLGPDADIAENVSALVGALDWIETTDIKLVSLQESIERTIADIEHRLLVAPSQVDSYDLQGQLAPLRIALGTVVLALQNLATARANVHSLASYVRSTNHRISSLGHLHVQRWIRYAGNACHAALQLGNTYGLTS